MKETAGYHCPVLLHETVATLGIDPQGVYVDGTVGGGGHAAAIAEKLKGGHLYAIDRDPDAVQAARERLKGLPATVVQANFTEMAQVLRSFGVERVNGVLLDLGVSSHQLDDPARGFSYHRDAPLDMRMSCSGFTAADVCNTCSEQQLCEIFTRFGEEKFARRIARVIVRERTACPVNTTGRLAQIIREAVPAAARREKHPARRVFQALRIAVNDELGALSRGLDIAFDRLIEGGRLAVITFHSLEDRMVKERFAEWRTGCICPPESPVCTCFRTPAAKAVLKKPVRAGERELEQNPRARSAGLRCVEKLHERYTENTARQ